MLPDIRMDLEIAAGYGECPVCFEPMCTNGASVMTDGSERPATFFRPERLPKRTCRHFFCQQVGNSSDDWALRRGALCAIGSSSLSPVVFNVGIPVICASDLKYD